MGQGRAIIGTRGLGEEGGDRDRGIGTGMVGKRQRQQDRDIYSD